MPLPKQVDLSNYLTYIRHQGGEGCWGYAGCAIWDILNEISSPNSPNMSMNLWLMLHRRRDVWEKPFPPNQGRIQTPDGRYHTMTNPEFGFFQSFGNTTEGTEPHVGSVRWTGSFTDEGINEVANYRLKAPPTGIDVSSEKFKEELAKSHPIRLSAGPHVVAILGYDDTLKTAKLVERAGDHAHKNGFGTFTFAEIENKKIAWLGNISGAETFEVIPPRPVPAARIWVKHNMNRMNVNLWLSAEGSPRSKKKIWPAWELTGDTSTNLHFTVRLPSEFIWPPSPSNRLILDLHDSGAVSEGGGEIVDFKATFGKHVVNCAGILNAGPIPFNTLESKRLYIP